MLLLIVLDMVYRIRFLLNGFIQQLSQPPIINGARGLQVFIFLKVKM